MVSLRYKSFVLGIILTSITWSVILYMKSKLNEDNYALESHPDEIAKWKLRPRVLDSAVGINLHKSNIRTNLIKQHLIDQETNMIEGNDLSDDSAKDRHSKKSLQKLLNSTELIHLGMITSPEDQRIKDQGYKRHAFNLLISDRLGFQRLLPYTQHSLCKSQVYEENLPKASVIICFYNEARSTLLRTVYSILDRTPSHLLHEIVLVDDSSDDEKFREELKQYLHNNIDSQKVKLLRIQRRAGLMRARVFGAQHSTGEVLVFLDSHCEVNEVWLEPLLQRIQENRTTVVCPIIDIINADTFEYVSSPIVRGGFNWGLHFKWDSVHSNQLSKKEDFIKPIESPTMAGGLFAIDKSYFHTLGEYDQGMDIWGGENLEISFRIWMCGGSLQIIPCSRVGHVFRRRRPYGSPAGEDTLTYNSLRVAHVWMDEYIENFFKVRPDARNKSYGDISSRLDLRKNLQCKSFDWYMKTIYPELGPPQVKTNLSEKKAHLAQMKNQWKHSTTEILFRYQIQLTGTELCIESEDDVTTKGSLLILQKCSKLKRQMWYESAKHDIRLAQLLCLDAGEQFPRLSKCHEMGGSQDWRHADTVDSPIYNMAAGLCLGVHKENVGEYIILTICSQSESRKWNLLFHSLP
ncbi:polypeptide N-acetylgalactosaminyltransferase 11 [Parasteatoda tepidariorum]|nr:polypeptide N-acetylgalactosaminyltransferase 11 [Parasteatoda tepidariorum]XP_042911130.1 polypeptide N-acetylgalactosaminyltransferase 11 [Parasteatoda tepidariorum]XP_042911131.1 polypeptide N-acetylgalactosaminyltransferase 11 [Parasteatoda tepidariorum]